MSEKQLQLQLRQVNGIASIIDIQGDLTAFAEEKLTKISTEVCIPGIRVILLNLSEMEYMNSSGIGLLVTLLIRVNRQKQRLIAYGLTEHYQHIFQLTRLSDSIQIYADESAAIKSLRPFLNPSASRPGFLERR